MSSQEVLEKARTSETLDQTLVPEILEGVELFTEQMSDAIGPEIERYLDWQSTNLGRPFSGYSSTIDNQVRLGVCRVTGLPTEEPTILEQAFVNQVKHSILEKVRAGGRFIEVRIEDLFPGYDLTTLANAPAGFRQVLDGTLARHYADLKATGHNVDTVGFLRSIKDSRPQIYVDLAESLREAAADNHEGIFIDKDMIFPKE